ncbi:MAG: DUF924 domain-containing protein [Proteobacteria bacterium]|nr:DUF924 domain-containing protein [Pseudomonadota bacterium]
MNIATTQEILNFWFSDNARDKWFIKDESFDNEIKKLFLATYKKAKLDKENAFEGSPEGLLALVITLDQFPRNIFRDKKEAFAADNIALKAANDAIKKNYDKKLTNEQRKFLYMPFMHSEDIRDQRTCVALFNRIKDQQSVDYALKHKEIILRFSRFPHRNEILGRKSTDEELKFLTQPNSSF